mmetsp:Transcript_32880/g.56029  ORF Transcript_32880/g.56029 Transcript_32880/m.56029 type:complete len:80 (+) Transcript_32880:359-598(+)
MGIKDQQKWLKRNIERRELPLEVPRPVGDAVHLGLKAVQRGAVVRRGARRWQQSNRYSTLKSRVEAGLKQQPEVYHNVK